MKIFLLISALATLSHGENRYKTGHTWALYGFQPISYISEYIEYDANAFNVYMNRVCQARDQGEYFRLEDLTPDFCGTVGTCHLLSGNYFLDKLECGKGHLYDVDMQKCLKSEKVKNCDRPWKIKDVSKDIADPLAYRNTGSDQRAERCNEQSCPAKTCYCSRDGTGIPGGLERSETPQMISISFQNGVGQEEVNTFSRIFSTHRENPNGCTIKGNWFVSVKYSNYVAIEQLNNYGHEIASMSVTRTDSSLYWTKPRPDTYTDEYVGSREILQNFANVNPSEVVGMRVPYLYLGGERQFQMMEQNGFLYDSTVAVQYNDAYPPVWPYNLKFGMPHRCHSFVDDNCPNFEKPYNVWEIPLNEIDRTKKGEQHVTGCATLSNCPINDPEHLKYALEKHFKRHYNGTRAPIVLTFDAGYFRARYDFLKTFVEWVEDVLANYKDAYFVTNKQIIDWINNPTPVSQLKDFELWKGKTCKGQRRASTSCSFPNSCHLPTTFRGTKEDMYLFTCSRCPNYYPWIRNTNGFVDN